MDRGLRRIAIVNRGEAAMRLVNAVRELRHEHDDRHPGDRPAHAGRAGGDVRPRGRRSGLHRRRPTARRRQPVPRPRRPGARARRRTGRRGVGRLGVRRRAPGVRRAVRATRHRVHRSRAPTSCAGSATRSAPSCWPSSADVPVAPWSGGPVDSLDEARRHAGTIGYPLMIKATAGGGGRGIRRVDDEDGLAAAFDSARAEGLKAFGDATVFMERVVDRRPPRRGAADRRRPRHGVGGRRPRLQHAAAQPEGHRGVAVHRADAGRRTESCGRPRCAWPRPPATRTPGRSSSSTSRPSGGSPSSRSTPGSRSSTRSPS